MAGNLKRKEPDIRHNAPDNLKRKEPDDDDEVGVVPKRRRLNLAVINRRRVPINTLIGIGEDNTVILSMGIPTKKQRLMRFNFSPEGEATRAGSTTEQEFTASFPNVYRMNRSATLAMNGTIEPARLSTNVSTVRSMEIVEDKPDEEMSELKEGVKRKTSDIVEGEAEQPKPEIDVAMETPLPDQNDEEDQSDEPTREPVREEDKILKATKETQEEIADLAHTEHPSNEPKEMEKVPDDPYSENVIIKNYMDLLQAQMKESPPDKMKKQFEELQMLSKMLKGEEVKSKSELDVAMETPLPDEMPANLKRVEDVDMEHVQQEKEEIKKITKKEVKDVEMAIESSDAMLSKGEAVNVPITDISTGHHNEMEIENQLNKEHTDVDKGTTVAAKDRKDVPTPVDEDVEMADPNTENKITLGADAETDRVDLPSAHSSSNTASANKMESTIGPMEVEIPEEARAEQERIKEQKKEISISAKQFQEKRKTLKGFETKVIERQEKLLKEGEVERAKQRKTTLELMQTGGDIPGFEEMMTTLTRQDIVKDPEDIQARKRVLAILRKDNKIMDVRTAAAPSEQDILAASVREQAGALGTGQRGGTGIGTPIFSPSSSRENLYDLQRGVATLTQTEAIEIREELTPLWNEFKLGRMSAGVKEMERMPTRLLKSDVSTVKASSRVRADMKQEEESFGYFMYWLLHDRLDPTKETTWRAFLTYAAALGYNDLTQTQINWMITGNENGDLDSNTIFSEVSAEEGDPLDVLLDVRGAKISRGTVKSLSAQVIGNPEPQAQYPSRNTSPSAAPVDNSIHPDGSTGVERQTRQTFAGVPSFVMNIPDPRFSRRGGIDVPNVRLITRRNPNYDPTIQNKLKPGDEGYQEEFITEEVPDVGVGSKDIGAAIAAAQSDRLLRAIPTKLYAPIHPQACDRYLGTLNYQRLSLPIERYMKSYSQHPWGPTDFQQMYNWNVYTMALYGGMLYAFVTDINMQRTSPVFDMNTPEAVGDEYMELNELINELARFQQNADDRADRVTDSGAAQRPLEEQLDKFHQDQSIIDKEKLFQGDVAIISTEGLSPFPTGGSGSTGVNPSDVLPPGDIPQPPGPVIPSGGDPTPWPGGGPDPRVDKNKPWAPNNDHRQDEDKPLSPDNDLWPRDLYTTFASHLKPPTQIGATMMDKGISNKDEVTITAHQKKDVEMERKNKMYTMFFRR